MDKFIKPLGKWKKDELNAELALYGEIEGVEVKKFGVIATNVSKVDEITRLRNEKGYALRVDEAFVEVNKETDAKDAKVGEILLFTQEDVDGYSSAVTEAEEAKERQAEEDKAKEAEKSSGTGAQSSHTETEGKGKEQESEETSFGDVEHVLNGKTVVRFNNKLINGKLYKEVHVASGEAFTLTVAEFEEQVKPRFAQSE